MLNDSRIYQDTLRELEPLISCTQISKAPNAIFDEHTLNVSVINAAIRDSSVGGCANAAKHAMGNASPSDRWCASMLKSTHADKLEEIFQEMVQKQIHIMKSHNKIPRKGITIAVDLHLIPRYDKKPGDDLTRSKYKRGTKYFERYMSVQCVSGRARITLGVRHLKMGDSVPKSLDVMIKDVLNMGVRINLALLDREFFSAQSIEYLQKRKMSFLTPCKNTGNVVAALQDYARNSRLAVSKNVIENNERCVEYDMIITERKKTKDTSTPEERYIGFATNVPTHDTKEYAARWSIETTYRLIEEMRPKTRIKDVASRMFCFFYAMAAYNEWMILRMLYSDDSEHQCELTQLLFKQGIASVTILEPKPPP